MIIKFSVDGIKNMDLLYTWTNAEVAEGVSVIKNEYNGSAYCKKVIDDITDRFPEMIVEYKGMVERIANEKFLLSMNGREYELSFGIKTYNCEMASIECVISQSDLDEYNNDLEEIKIALKDRLLNDWKVCTWLFDDQSERLCNEAFQLAYHVENNLRAFASKVLIHFLGINWLNSFGLDKYADSVNELKGVFVQRVPEFDDINTDFLSMTLETLVEILFKGVIYEDRVVLNRQDYLEVQKMGNKERVKASSVAEFIEKKRVVSKEIWKEYFLNYIDNPNEFQKKVHDFISGRNHVAHCKILSRSSYRKIEKDFFDFDGLIKKADEKFELEEVSQEIRASWDAEDDMRQEQEEYERSYYRDRLSSETGMSILSVGEIIDWFNEVLHNLYDDIYQNYNLDICYELSEYTCISDGYELFSISCPAVDDGSAKITIGVDYDTDDGLGEDSTCSIICKNGNNIFP